MLAAMEAARGAISQFACFELEMRRVERRGEFLMLLPERGGEAVRALHDALYAGPFARWYAPEFAYEPHVTLGRGEFAFAREDLGVSFVCTVRQVVLERIGADGSSEIMERIPLKYSGGQKNEDRCEQLQFSSGGVGGADEHL